MFTRVSVFGSSSGRLPACSMECYQSDASLLAYWNLNVHRGCRGCSRLQGRPQPAFCGHCCAGCRDGEESKDKCPRANMIHKPCISAHLIVVLRIILRSTTTFATACISTGSSSPWLPWLTRRLVPRESSCPGESLQHSRIRALNCCSLPYRFCCDCC